MTQVRDPPDIDPLVQAIRRKTQKAPKCRLRRDRFTRSWLSTWSIPGRELDFFVSKNAGKPAAGDHPVV